MSRRKITKEQIRNIQKSSGSYHVSIPMEIMRDFKWKERPLNPAYSKILDHEKNHVLERLFEKIREIKSAT